MLSPSSSVCSQATCQYIYVFFESDLWIYLIAGSHLIVCKTHQRHMRSIPSTQNFHWSYQSNIPTQGCCDRINQYIDRISRHLQSHLVSCGPQLRSGHKRTSKLCVIFNAINQFGHGGKLKLEIIFRFTLSFGKN